MSDNIPYEDGQSQRLFPRRFVILALKFVDASNRDRARELREEGLVSSAWFPSTIKQPSTPARGGASEELSSSKTSPEQQMLADLAAASGADSNYRRARAGTVPSSFGASPAGQGDSYRFKPEFSSSHQSPGGALPAKENDTLGALPDLRTPQEKLPASRLRAGSLTLPHSQNAYSSAFGPSIFSTSWSQRIKHQEFSSPAQSNFSRDDEQTPIKTLDYLGLAETPTPPRPLADMSNAPNANVTPMPFLGGDVSNLRRDPNRIRSYSVNAKERYDDEIEEQDLIQDLHDRNSNQYGYSELYRTGQTPSRPRSRTAGVLDSPPSLRSNKFAPIHSHMENFVTAADLETYTTESAYPATHDLTARLNSINNMDTTHYEDNMNNMGGYIQSQPTRALWLGNIPSSTPSAALLAMFSSFGAIESARVLTHKSCAFVNFEMLESAIIARSAFNGKELFPGAGAVRIGFAKVPSATSSATPEPYNLLDADALGSNGADSHEAKPPTVADMEKELLSLVGEYGAQEDEQAIIKKTLQESSKYTGTYEDVPVTTESSTVRRYDAPRLRDIRKRIDNGDWTQAEIEGIAQDMLDEISELASDYLGNTVVQKLFEFCAESTKLQMLECIAPHLAEIGVHKNGTWAAQKIIDTANTPAQMAKVSEALRSTSPSLFLDQFGNYVVQCCLKFEYPHNDFIFQAMLSHTWQIAQGRYGARAMRACLESHHTSKAQQRLLAAVITIHSVQLATNANGALLLTWLLDTCMLPNRHRLLAPKLSQYLVHLCTHKLASLTVLKVINQRQEPEARDLIIENLFFSEGDRVLEAILQDQAHGPTVIFKIITTPYLEADLRTRIVSNVRTVIQRHRFTPANGIKRLMDEVGLSSRSLTSTTQDPGRPANYSTQYSASHYGAPLDPGLSGPRSTAGIDPATIHALGDLNLTSNGSSYGMTTSQMQQQMQRLQYQAMLQQTLRHPQYGYAPHMGYNDPYAINSAYGNYASPQFTHQQHLYQSSSGSPVQRRR